LCPYSCAPSFWHSSFCADFEDEQTRGQAAALALHQALYLDFVFLPLGFFLPFGFFFVLAIAGSLINGA
jgi:hypothetical protein